MLANKFQKNSKLDSKNNRRSYPPTKICRKNEGVPSSSGSEPFHVSSYEDPHRGGCSRQWSRPTQIFCKKINDLFDIINFNSILSAIEYKRALAKNSVSVSYLREMLIWIENLKTLNSKEKIITKKFKCLEG